MQSNLMSCWLQIWLLLFSGMVVAYLSPVYKVLPELHQAFSCPNNTPLHFLNSHFTSKGDRKSLQLQCLDSYNYQYTGCGQAFPGLHAFGTVYHPITISCNPNCFISGVFITNRTIASFMCSKTIEHYFLINCTRDTNYTLSSIGDQLLPENSAISSLNALLTLGSEKLTYWKYEFCFFISNDLCNYNEDEVNINHFHARKVRSNVWKFSCSNGYKLIGPNTYNCNEMNILNTTYILKDNCEDCCSPVALPNILTSCTNDNFTQLDCENGKFLSGSAGSNKYCSSFLKYHGHSLFSCETCNTTINYCDICGLSSSNGVLLCSTCSHPNRYPMKLTKNQKKCKIIALVTSLTFKRTIHNWTISCITIGSPKVTSSLYVNDIKRVSVEQKRIIFNEPILPYNAPRTIECVATNNWGMDSRHMNLSIISILFDTQYVYTPFPGSRIIMNCVLIGDFDVWNWTFNNTPILPGNDNFNLLSNTSLEIKNVSNTHQGMYQCTVRNPTEEKSIHKTLYYTKPEDIWSTIENYTNTINDNNETGEPPTIIMWTSKYEAVEGSTIVLHCTVTGLPMPVIAWMKNEQFIMVTGVMDGHKICNTKSVRLNNITASDHEGFYKCIAANVNGRDSRSVFIDVISKQSFVAKSTYIGNDTAVPTSHVTSSSSHVTSSSSHVTFFSNHTFSHVITSTSETTPTSTDISISPSTILLVHIVLIFILLVMSTLFLCILKLVNQKYIM